MVLFALSVVGGIIFCSKVKLAGIIILIVAVILSLFPLTAIFKTESVFSLIITIILFVISSLNYLNQDSFRENYMETSFDERHVSAAGQLYKIEKSDNGYKLFISDCNVKINSDKFQKCNNIIVYIDKNEYLIGEWLKVTGKMKHFKSSTNEGEFDLGKFYKSQKIDFAVKAENIDVYNDGTVETIIKQKLYKIRETFCSNICRITDIKNSGIINSMIMGDKSLLDTQIKELYQASGISHILAISGLHISMIGMSIYKLLRKKGIAFWQCAIFVSCVLAGYAFMTGNSVSTKRAIGMCICFMIAETIGRKTDILTSLSFIAIILLLQNPFLLDYAGFILSFMTIISIYIVVPGMSDMSGAGNADCVSNTDSAGNADRVSNTDSAGNADRVSNTNNTDNTYNRNKRYIDKIKFKINKNVWSGIGMQLPMFPVIAYYFYEIPIYAVLVNLIIIPCLPLVFISALIAGNITYINTVLGRFLIIPAVIVLDVYEKICKMVCGLPMSSLIVGKPGTVKMCIFYILILTCMLLLMRCTKQVKRIFIKCTFIILCVFVISFKPAGEFRIDILDVGQGDGIFIQTENSVSMFIDGGSTDKKKTGKNIILAFLKSRGMAGISYWFISHSDEDHINGMLEVLESGYKIENIVVSDISTLYDEKTQEIMEMAQKYNVNIIKMSRGDSVVISDKTSVKCIYPNKDTPYNDKNDVSMAIMITSDLFKGIFAGDISGAAEKTIIADYNLGEMDLYKVNHHGSKSSSSVEWLESIRPHVSVVSCAKKNKYGHPAPETIDRLEKYSGKIFYTMNDGQITIKKSKKGKLTVSRYAGS